MESQVIHPPPAVARAEKNPRFVIEGGRPVGGTIRPAGNKNAALPLIAATTLTEGTVVLHNVPDIQDVRVMMALVEELGVTVEALGGGSYAFHGGDLNGRQPDRALCRGIRASILLAGPVLGRRGFVDLPPPGGDVIGRRRIDTHVLALEALGARMSLVARDLRFETPAGLVGTEIFLDEASVTATENALMAAALARGTTTILNAAGEPHVQDLCALLVAMGGRVSGAGTNRLTVEGVDRLHGAEYTLGPDYIEVGSLITLAAVTGGELRLVDARPEEHRATRVAFGRLGIRFEIADNGRDLVVPGGQALRVAPDLGGAIPKVEDAPWPGFPADLTSMAVVAATQSDGTVLIHEKLFESRLFFTDRLAAMGARLILCDPHRVVVTGPSRLLGQELVSPDIRAGMALLIAALCAEGKSTIHNVQQIDRGYERIEERLRSLGAEIERVTD